MENKIMENTRYKILLIEDDELDQMAFKRFVENNAIPYDCTLSGSVSQAKQVLNSNQFDIIITDHSLGDGTAFDVLESAKNTPVIVVTGAGDEETAVKTWKAGAYDYLVKDINQNYLKAIPIALGRRDEHGRQYLHYRYAGQDCLRQQGVLQNLRLQRGRNCRTKRQPPMDRKTSKPEYKKRFPDQNGGKWLGSRFLSSTKR
jgi:DNA-binding response OmpR family regulator